MNKTEFREQFKRLRVAGYRLPTFDGVTVDDVMDEWFRTFQDVPRYEFEEAIDRLKKDKTDTFWPATGELWAHIFEIRKARRIRHQASDHGGAWAMSDDDTQNFLGVLRAARDKILGRMTMPRAVAQVEPDHVLREQDDQDRAAEGDVNG